MVDAHSPTAPPRWRAGGADGRARITTRASAPPRTRACGGLRRSRDRPAEPRRRAAGQRAGRAGAGGPAANALLVARDCSTRTAASSAVPIPRPGPPGALLPALVHPRLLPRRPALAADPWRSERPVPGRLGDRGVRGGAHRSAASSAPSTASSSSSTRTWTCACGARARGYPDRAASRRDADPHRRPLHRRAHTAASPTSCWRAAAGRWSALASVGARWRSTTSPRESPSPPARSAARCAARDSGRERAQLTGLRRARAG